MITWDEAVVRYGRVVKGEANRLASGISKEDLEQMGYLWLGEHLKEIDAVEHSSGDAGAWVRTGLRRHMPEWRKAEHDQTGHEKPSGLLEDETGTFSPDPGDSPEYDEDPVKFAANCMLRAVDDLPPSDREIVRRVFWEDIGIAELAGELGLSPKSVGTRYREAMQQVGRDTRKYMAEAGQCPPDERRILKNGSCSEGFGGRA